MGLRVATAEVRANWGSALRVSDNFAELTGIAADDFCADPSLLTDLVIATDRPGLDALAGDRTASACVAICDLRNGGTRPLLVGVEPYPDEPGRPGGFTLTLADASAASRDRQDLAARLEAAEADRDSAHVFVVALTHELRSSLNSLLGSAQLLASESLEPRARRATDRMSSAGSQVRALLDDVLDVARLASGGMALDATAIDLAAHTAEVVDSLHDLAEEREASVVCDDSLSGVPPVRADGDALDRVLVNLIQNALRHCGRHGEVRISASTTDDEGAVRVRVADSGPGVAEGTDVFEPFRRGADTAGTSGSGVGLHLCRRFIEAMGGHIGYEPGPGGAFWFELVPAPVAVRAGQTGAARRAAVVAIDDDPDNLDLLCDALESLDAPVHATTSGQRGLQLARQVRPAVVVTDLRLGDMDGAHLVADLAADPTTAHIPVVVLTGAGDSELPGSVARVLRKPVDLTELTSEVSRHLARRRQQPGSAA